VLFRSLKQKTDKIQKPRGQLKVTAENAVVFAVVFVLNAAVEWQLTIKQIYEKR